ncbi:polygalacturonase-like [Nymphaea colorata]|nr:polygalacturonase-like [Nymphaea colorata]
MGNSSNLLIMRLIIILVALVQSLSAKTLNVVADYGAKADGVSDNSASFLKAWKDACSTAGEATVYVPSGQYLLRPTLFSGPCVCTNITVQVDGKLIPRTDSEGYGTSSYWLQFQGVKGMTFKGGYLDGKGSALWSCKAGKGMCPDGARTLVFQKVRDVLVTGTTSINSQLFHIVIDGSQNVRVDRVDIVAPNASPNTDGIHVEDSTGVTLTNSNIGTGDDCISIGQGTQNLWIEGIKCGPGHGISIGSLGKQAVEPGVQNVTVKNVIMTGTQNGLRIKSWARKSTGFVKSVLFDGATMNNVDYPIIIDQYYCPDRINCPGQNSGVKISQVIYSNVRGTSATQVAVLFKCSPSSWCQGIRMSNVQLSYRGQPSTASCQNAIGTASGLMVPQSCLQLSST